MSELNFARLQAVIQSMSAGVISTDADRRIVWANAAFSSITGYALDEVRGRRPLDFLPGPGIDPAQIARLRERLDRHEAFECELPMRRKDGAVRWLQVCAQPVLDEHGTCREQVAVLTDVTERREADEVLRRSTALLEATQSTAQVGGWSLEVATGRLYWTAETFRIHETTPQAYRPEVGTAIAFYLPSSVPVIESAVRRAIEGREYEVEVEIVTARGRRRWVRTTGRPVMEDGRVVQVVGAIRDVTEQRQVEAERRAGEARLRAMVEHAPLGIMLTSPDGMELTYLNSAMLRMSGLDAEEARRRGTPLSVHPDDVERLRREWERARSLGVPHSLAGRFLRPDGTVAWWESTTSPVIIDGEVAAHVIMVQDVSERLALEREIVEVAGREQQRLGSALHEGLGQELTGLAISLESLARRAAAGGNPLQGDLRELSGLASQSVALCREVAAGLAPMQLARGGLRNALRSLAVETRSLHGIDVRCAVRGVGAREVPPEVAHQLYRIAQEAVVNAVKDGGAGRVSVRMTRDGDGLSLSIVDDGRPMAERPAGGTALHTMRYRARMIEAELDAASIEMGGVRVSCRLRLPPRTARSPAHGGPRAAAAAAPGRRHAAER